MKLRSIFFILLFGSFAVTFVQPQGRATEFGDGELARQYVNWARQAIDEGRWNDALTALERASDFSNVSSDLSFLLATTRAHFGKNRNSIIEVLDIAIETNRWEYYDVNDALYQKAHELIAMRKYLNAISCLEQINYSPDRVFEGIPMPEALMAVERQRILAYRGLADTGDVSAGIKFRSLLLAYIDRYPRDTRPFRYFFQYAHNRTPDTFEPSVINAGWLNSETSPLSSDLGLMELLLRRLPFLLESDPELAWMAAPFIRDTEEARRLVASYRTGAISSVSSGGFQPHPSSIPSALNLGLIDDVAAVEELFSQTRGSNVSVPAGFDADGKMFVDRDVIIQVYNLLRSEEGRGLFTQKLLSFTGVIISDDNNDGYINGYAHYNSGIISAFKYDRDQINDYKFQIDFSSDGIPLRITSLMEQASTLFLEWERYPYAGQARLVNETYLFRPGDFQYAPVSFLTLGGSEQFAGLSYPAAINQIELTRRALIFAASSIRRPSREFEGAVEEIFLDRGAIPRQAVETINGRQVSVTEFDGGAPVVQYVDLDLDGRMETIRRFHSPGPDYPWLDSSFAFDYRRLTASSESDWSGDGRYKTGEVYLQDGSVVYSWDMDGSGTMNYSETESGN